MLTPIDIETVEFKKVALGYAPEGVDEFLNNVIIEFERLYKDNSSLKEQIKQLEDSLENYKSLEESIKSAIVLAEKTAAEAKKNASEQADAIIKKAQLKADEILVDIKSEKYQLESAVMELKSRYAILSSGIKGLINTELEYIEKSEALLNDAVPDIVINGAANEAAAVKRGRK